MQQQETAQDVTRLLERLADADAMIGDCAAQLADLRAERQVLERELLAVAEGGAEVRGLGYRVRLVQGKSRVAWSTEGLLEKLPAPLGDLLFPVTRSFDQKTAEALVKAGRVPEAALGHRAVEPARTYRKLESDPDFLPPVPTGPGAVQAEVDALHGDIEAGSTFPDTHDLVYGRIPF